MAKTKKLHSNQGADEVNHGTEKFRVDNEGNVEVPAEAAADLIKMGGFTEVEPDEPEVPTGLVKVIHDDATGLSWGGESFEPQADNSFHVPAAAVPDLIHHGFVAVEEVLAPAAKAEPKIPQLKLK